MKARACGDTEVADMVKMLAKLMRHSIEVRDSLVPVKDELSLTEYYLKLQHYRFGGAVQFTVTAESGCEQLFILPLLVQPLVENAVLHGMENNSDPCTVSLRSWFEDGQLLVEVRDDGAGIDPETAAKIMDGTYQKDYTRSSGVGLKNIVQRVRLYYGPQYGLRIEPMPQGGTLARLNLPQTPPDGLEGEQHENLAG